jgi:hypothetical protein
VTSSLVSSKAEDSCSGKAAVRDATLFVGLETTHQRWRGHRNVCGLGLASSPSHDHFAHLLLPAHYGNPCGHEEERLRRASEIEGREPGVPPAPSCRVWDFAPSDKSYNGREGSIIASLERGRSWHTGQEKSTSTT